MTHPTDSCGSRACTDCAPAARAAAIAIEQAVNTTEPAADTTAPAPAEQQTTSARVELSVFGRAVTVEATEPLTEVAAVAERLWRQMETAPMPVGAAGFVAADPDGSGPPAEMGTRVVGPYRDWEVRSAA